MATWARVLMTLRRDKISGHYLLSVTQVEDPDHRCMLHADDSGHYHDAFGAELSSKDIDLIDLFGGGRSYKRIAEHLGMSETTVKRRLAEISERMGFNSASEMRMALWKKHSREFIINNDVLFAGETTALYS